MSDKMWSLDDIAKHCSYSLTIAKRIVAQPGFPAPVRLWANAHPRWIERQVREWIESQQEAA